MEHQGRLCGRQPGLLVDFSRLILRIRRTDLNDRDMNEGNDQAPALKVPSVARADPMAAAR
jgi:hypothetical protein